jgi:AraC-like DNA-binding protein/quercetin dioxygenase-like cupin family protein
MGKREFYIEPTKEGGAFDGMEFFLQSTRGGEIAAHAHIHESIELLYAKSGSFTVLLDGSELEFREGDLILFPSNSLHYVTAGESERNSYYVIKVKPSLLLDLVPAREGTTYLLRFSLNRPGERYLWKASELREGAISEAIDRLITEYEGNGYAKALAMKLHVAELLLAILRDGGAAHESTGDVRGDELTGRIYAAVLYLRSHFNEDVDASAISARLGISYSYFSRAFGRITGKSFKEYLNLTRVNHAEQLLLTTQKSVTEISALCGYNNVSYFISVYRRLKGSTPSRTARGSEHGEKM